MASSVPPSRSRSVEFGPDAQADTLTDLHHLVVPRQADKSCLLKNVENSVGVNSPNDPCGLDLLP